MALSILAKLPSIGLILPLKATPIFNSRHSIDMTMTTLNPLAKSTLRRPDASAASRGPEGTLNRPGLGAHLRQLATIIDQEPGQSVRRLRESYPTSQTALARGRFILNDEPAKPSRINSFSLFTNTMLRRPDHAHPFAPFLADDLTEAARAFEKGFDPFWRDERGMTCVMACASRGNSETLNLTLKHAHDPFALALLKTDIELDAFDMAASIGSVPCMSVLAKRLPSGYHSSIGHGLFWHAVEASRTNQALADAWLADLCTRPNMRASIDAIAHATSLGWSGGLARLKNHIATTQQK